MRTSHRHLRARYNLLKSNYDNLRSGSLASEELRGEMTLSQAKAQEQCQQLAADKAQLAQEAAASAAAQEALLLQNRILAAENQQLRDALKKASASQRAVQAECTAHAKESKALAAEKCQLMNKNKALSAANSKMAEQRKKLLEDKQRVELHRDQIASDLNTEIASLRAQLALALAAQQATAAIDPAARSTRSTATEDLPVSSADSSSSTDNGSTQEITHPSPTTTRTTIKRVCAHDESTATDVSPPADTADENTSSTSNRTSGDNHSVCMRS